MEILALVTQRGVLIQLLVLPTGTLGRVSAARREGSP